MEEVKRMDGVLVSMQGIEKYFPGVHALKNVSLELRKGEVLALLGENGAGKSTLMKILTGVYNKDEGQIFFEGKEVQIDNPKAAQELGISIIHQEFNLLPHLTVAQNIFIGREPRTKIRGVLNEKELNRKAQIILDDLNLSMSPKTRVAELSVAEQQMVEIAKALSVQCKVLIMDEPTAALTESEVEELFRVIKDLKSKGVGIVYISHRLEELEYIVDRVTVMRDGAYIGTVNYKDTTLDELISMMVGRDITEKFPKRNVNVGETILEVKGLSRKDVLKDINFKLRRGEILGIAGLMGAGRTELARAIFGADPIDTGEILLEGKPIKITSPVQAINAGIGYLSEDRKKDGVALDLDVESNVILASVMDYSNKMGIVKRKDCIEETNKQVKNLKVKTPTISQKVKFLSGGNQQKVIIGKWLCKDSKILIFDEPTRGIDVGAKFEIYQLMNKLVAEGSAIIMISSELPEILGMSDRILVMHEGEISGELDIKEASQEKIMYHATGGKKQGGEKVAN